MDELVLACALDRCLVEVLGLEHATFDPCHLRADQCGAVFKVLRAMLRPYLLLLLVSSQRLDMPLSRGVRCRINGRRARECTVKMILRYFEVAGHCPD